MAEIIELNDPFTYVMDRKEGKCIGVKWERNNKFLSIFLNGQIVSFVYDDIPPHELKQLMIMWLSLKYPDVLNFDDLEKNTKIKEDIK